MKTLYEKCKQLVGGRSEMLYNNGRLRVAFTGGPIRIARVHVMPTKEDAAKGINPVCVFYAFDTKVENKTWDKVGPWVDDFEKLVAQDDAATLAVKAKLDEDNNRVLASYTEGK